jgi:hypothetical protein
MVMAVFLVWLVGQVLRDRTWASGLCFYVPSPLAAFILAALAFLAWKRSARRMAVLALTLTAGPLVFVGWFENRWQAPRNDATSLSIRLIHWNVFGGNLGWSNIQHHLRAGRADIYVLSETPADFPMESLVTGLGAEFVGTRLGNMKVLARGQLTAEPMRVQSGHIKAFRVLWNFQGQELSLSSWIFPAVSPWRGTPC